MGPDASILRAGRLGHRVFAVKSLMRRMGARKRLERTPGAAIASAGPCSRRI
jgi:hypothetical protein